MPTPPGDQSHPNRNPSTTPARTRHGREPQPWLLPFQHLPVVLQDHGIAEAHVRPLVGRRLEDDSIRCWRTSPARAWRQALVEWSRTGMSFVALAFDIDSRLSLEHLAAASMGASDTIPTPNIAIYRKASGRAHAIFTLRRPVLRGPRTTTPAGSGRRPTAWPSSGPTSRTDGAGRPYHGPMPAGTTRSSGP